METKGNPLSRTENIIDRRIPNEPASTAAQSVTSTDVVEQEHRPVFRRRHEYYDQPHQGVLHEGRHHGFDERRQHRELSEQPRYIAATSSSDSINHAFRPVSQRQTPPYRDYGMGTPRSSSYDSHRRHPTTHPTYPYPPPPPPPHPSFQYYQWTPVPPVEYIIDIKPDDVLSGRGGATNSHSGNRAFRSLVKRHQDEYLKAKKRDKPSVASKIVEHIREKGGRFLRRIDTTPQGQVLWVDIGDDRAREKTCQALREGAPEIRRKRKASSTDEEDTKRAEDHEGDISASSSMDRSASNDEGSQGKPRRTPIVRRASGAAPWAASTHQQSAPIMIRPSPALVRRRIPEAISVDQLSTEERDMYLRYFLPPDPGIRQNPGRNRVLGPSQPYTSPGSPRDESSKAIQVVKV